MQKLLGTQEFWAGALFILLGLGFLTYATQYRIGTPDRMGPAFVPVILAALLTVLGVASAARGLRKEATPLYLGRLRPLAVIVLAVLLFGALLQPAGLVIATIVLVLVSTQAGENFRLREALSLALLMAVIAAVVFVYGLGVSAPLWPTF